MTDELFCKQYHAPAGFVQPHRLSGRPPETPLLVAFSGGADYICLQRIKNKLEGDTKDNEKITFKKSDSFYAYCYVFG